MPLMINLQNATHQNTPNPTNNAPLLLQNPTLGSQPIQILYQDIRDYERIELLTVTNINFSSVENSYCSQSYSFHGTSLAPGEILCCVGNSFLARWCYFFSPIILLELPLELFPHIIQFLCHFY